MLFKSLLYLREVCFDNIGHSFKVFEQFSDLLLQLMSKSAQNFRFHFLNSTLDILLVINILRYETALNFHYCFNDKLELITYLRFFFVLQDVVVSQDLSDDFMELIEGVRKHCLDSWFSKNTMLL
jgi:hypothetical protein